MCFVNLEEWGEEQDGNMKYMMNCVAQKTKVLEYEKKGKEERMIVRRERDIRRMANRLFWRVKLMRETYLKGSPRSVWSAVVIGNTERLLFQKWFVLESAKRRVALDHRCFPTRLETVYPTGGARHHHIGDQRRNLGPQSRRRKKRMAKMCTVSCSWHIGRINKSLPRNKKKPNKGAHQ